MGATGFHGPCWVHMVVGSSWVLLDPRCSGLDRPNWISATCCWFAAPMVIRAPGSRASCNAFHNGSYDFLACALSFPNGSYDFTEAVMAFHKGSYDFCELQTGSHCKTKADPKSFAGFDVDPCMDPITPTLNIILMKSRGDPPGRLGFELVL